MFLAVFVIGAFFALAALSFYVFWFVPD